MCRRRWSLHLSFSSLFICLLPHKNTLRFRVKILTIIEPLVHPNIDCFYLIAMLGIQWLWSESQLQSAPALGNAILTIWYFARFLTSVSLWRQCPSKLTLNFNPPDSHSSPGCCVCLKSSKYQDLISIELQADKWYTIDTSSWFSGHQCKFPRRGNRPLRHHSNWGGNFHHYHLRWLFTTVTHSHLPGTKFTGLAFGWAGSIWAGFTSIPHGSTPVSKVGGLAVL